jgi:hypothetical protein
LVPNSSSLHLTAAGQYAYKASFTSSNGNYAGVSGDCEPFQVAPGQVNIDTAVFNETTMALIGTSPVALGSTVHDTATLDFSPPAVAPAGTVAYTLWTGGTGNCASGTATPAGGGVVVDNANGTVTVPNSNSHHLTAVGQYAYKATFTSSNGNYAGVSSTCEPFEVAPGQVDIDTAVFNETTGAPIGDSPVALGSTVHDTATLAFSSSSVVPAGTVTYTLFTGGTGNCASGTPTVEAPVAVGTSGLVPNSTSVTLTAAGQYAYEATFTSSNGNYAGVSSDCEPFEVAPGQVNIDTAVFNETTGALIGNSAVALGSTVHDTATLDFSSSSVVPAGTVTYTLWTGGTGNCASGTPTVEAPVPVGASGLVPNSTSVTLTAAGQYAYEAMFTPSNSNYAGVSSDCEPFEVAPGQVNIDTAVFNETTGAVIGNGPVALGSTVHDTATLAFSSSSVVPAGTVTYTLWTGGTGNCASGTATVEAPVPVGSSGLVPNSSSLHLAAAGQYAYEAVFTSANNNYAGVPSDCEPFEVAPGQVNIDTAVFNETTGALIGNSPVALGSTVHDTATLDFSASAVVPAGSVSYTLWTGGAGDCASGTPTAEAPVPVGTSGLVPNSSSVTLTAAGQYAYEAMFTPSNGNYTGVASDCQPFDMDRAVGDPSTTVFDASTKAPVSHVLPLGARVFDTTKLTSTAGIAPTGKVKYTFFHSSDCTASTAAGTETVTVETDGTVPNSSIHGPLGSGLYAFNAHYSGDGNYLAGTSACEPLSVDKAPVGFSTTVMNAATNQPVSGTLPSGAMVFDTAKLTTTSGITPTGTVTYAFFRAGTCITGTLVATDTVTIGAGGSVPPSSIQTLTAGGPYSFEAEYSSDANFLGTGSGCEPLVPVAPPSPITPASLPVTG